MELKYIFGVSVLVSSVFALVNCSPSVEHDVLIKKNCTKFKPETKNKTKLETYEVTETYSGMCKVDNRYYVCTKEKTETKSRIITDTYTEFVSSPVCCDGYQEIDGKCAPICENPCENGFCSTPNQCKCHDNYTITEIGSVQHCQPICDDCKYGNCIEPNVCECYEGYRLENGFCEPVCERECVNGKCEYPNVCSCEEDHKQLNELNVCHPICDFNENCTNGNCTAPGRYNCFDDFEPSSGYNCTCLPISTDNLQYTKPSGFKWYIIGIMLLAIFATTTIFIIKFHFQRKVNYCLKDEVDWPIRYYGYDDDGTITTEIIESYSK